MCHAPSPRFRLRRQPMAALAAALWLAPALAAGTPPREMTLVDARRLADGTTLVRLSENAPLAPDGYRVVRLDGGPPRVLVVLTGIARHFRPESVTIDDANLRQIRIGYHAEVVPPELHVVLDLSGEDVGVLAETLQGPDLLLRVGRRQPQPAAAVQPTLALRPSRLRWDQGGAAPVATPEPPPPPPALPSPCLRGVPGTTVLYYRADGSSLLRVSADRPYGATDIKYRRDWQEPSVYELVVAASATGLPEELEVDSGCLQRILVSEEEGATPPRTTLRLLLVSPEVEVAQVAGLAEHAVVLITAPK